MEKQDKQAESREQSMSIVPEISARTLLTPMKNAQWWFGGDYNMNLYRGCCHGCIYCDSRSECYGNDQFDTVMVKKDVLTLLEKDGTRALLTGDLNNLSGDETRLGPEIGKIDLLKIGHHGYVFSSSQKFLNTLSPEVTVATNRRSKMIYPTVKWRLALTGSALFTTVDYNGVMATFPDGGGLVMTDHIMNEEEMALTIPTQK